MDRQGADALRAVLRANSSLGGEVVVFFGEFLQNVGEASRYRCLPTLNRRLVFVSWPLWRVRLGVGFGPTQRAADTATPWGNVGGLKAR